MTMNYLKIPDTFVIPLQRSSFKKKVWRREQCINSRCNRIDFLDKKFNKKVKLLFNSIISFGKNC